MNPNCSSRSHAPLPKPRKSRPFCDTPLSVSRSSMTLVTVRLRPSQKKLISFRLGELKRRYLETVGNQIKDALFLQMWKEINENRIFLMHNFFHVFPVTALD